MVAVKVYNLGSGSTGNSLLIQHGAETLLLDCGVGVRAISAAVKRLPAPASLPGLILLSHEHSDHVRSLDRLVNSKLPLLATAGTLRSTGTTAAAAASLIPDSAITHDCWEITALRVQHDAAEPVGFSILAGNTRITVLTDLGTADPRLHDVLAASDLVVLEANHDESLVRNGPYPAQLKRRILSPRGHLSNRDCGIMLNAALSGPNRIQAIWLAHLSRTNNNASIATTTVQAYVSETGSSIQVSAMAPGGDAVPWEPGVSVPRQSRLPFAAS